MTENSSPSKSGSDLSDLFVVWDRDRRELRKAVEKNTETLVPVFFCYEGEHSAAALWCSFWEFFDVPDPLVPFFPRVIIWIDEDNACVPFRAFRRLGVKAFNGEEFIPLEEWM